MPNAADPTNFMSVLHEDRVFPPPDAFAQRAHIRSLEQYRALWTQSVEAPEEFWGKAARDELVWSKPFTRVLQWREPFAHWFLGGQLNASVNCLDRWLDTPTANKAALIWEGEPAVDGKPGEERTYTYRQLHREVCRFASVLRGLGATKGDRIIIYLPLIPEAVIAMLACARVGAIHSVVFGGFSAQSIADRVKDCSAKIIITADGGFRRGNLLPLKHAVDEALELKDPAGAKLAASIQKVLVVRRACNEVTLKDGRDVWLHEALTTAPRECPAEPMDSEDILFILYTSGSTGKPKGIQHSTAGYLLGTRMTARYVFDLQDTDIFWCTADIGWITGHSYVTYGPLANGATVLIYEGAPNYPAPDRFWQLIEKYHVSVFYTAPTAIRTFMKWGNSWLEKHDLSSLRLLGTVGEPINPEAWMWYHQAVGGGRCPIVDTWWQTETGAIMISPLPGAIPAKPGSATLPFFGICPEVVDDQGNAVPPNSGGKLVIRKPWPSMLRGIWGDPDRFRPTYWSEVPGSYFTGDGCRKDEQGYFWIVGRIDDVLNVAGHRIGTAEVESALVSHPSVAEAAVVGRPDELKGQALVAFVTLKSGHQPGPALRDTLRNHVAREIGPVAKPDDIRFTDSLPKTRSGKIMRRLLKQVAAGAEIKGDVTTLEDLTVLTKLAQTTEP